MEVLIGHPLHRPTTVVCDDIEETWNIVFQGSLADCELWIRLHEKGYM